MLSGVITAGLALIDKLIPDQVAKDKAKIKLMALSQAGGLKELEAKMSIIASEARSDHWIVAAWRPITMLTFVVIIANNYILYPYLSLFWEAAPALEIPADMWALLKIGLGGYVVGRSAEKVAVAYKK
jgi:hypothetical protein